jgi:calnexin
MLKFLLLTLVVLCLSQTETTPEHTAPKFNGSTLFFENFNSDPFTHGWIASKNPKYNGVWKWSNPLDVTPVSTDKGLLLTDEARHYAIAKATTGKRDMTKPFVFQYEVKFETSSGISCGGAYVKLLASSKDLEHFDNETPYVIMFGPDKCGSTEKVHFIIRHLNPISKVWEEKHMENPPAIKNDQVSHLYTLVVRPDNTFEVLIDLEVAKKGSLETDFKPAFTPEKEIDDVNDKKPSNWVDTEEMDDPSASKPLDWNEDAPMEIVDQNDKIPQEWDESAPSKIADPTAKKPEDWNDEEDGAWIAPEVENPQCAKGCGKWTPRMIKNPEYKGKWVPPKIKNPEYKGVWAPKKVTNPNYFEEKFPSKFPDIEAVGIEVWQMTKNILFDNFIISQNVEAVEEYGRATWRPKYVIQKEEIAKNAPAAPNQVTQALEEIKDRVLDVLRNYPIPIVSTIVVLILSIVFLCCCGGGDNKTHDDLAHLIKKREEKKIEPEVIKVVEKKEEVKVQSIVEEKSDDVDLDVVEKKQPVKKGKSKKI